MRPWDIVASSVLCGVLACSAKDPPAHEPPKQSRPGDPSSSGSPSRSGSSDPARGSNGGDSQTPQPFHEQAESPTKPAEAMIVKYRVTWANVYSSPSCWYFSGPAGRDTPLGERIEVRIDGGHAAATWSKATFEGTWGETEIDVLRLATHSFQGTWVISERLTGRRKEQGIHAKYTYSECQQGTTCPGDCKITANVLLVPE